MKRTKILTTILLVACFLFHGQKTLASSREARPSPIHMMDSLLSAYHGAAKQARQPLARQIIAMNDDNLLTDMTHGIDHRLPADRLDFLVWLAAERFYYNKSYFKESLEYIDKALTLAEGNTAEYHATTACRC